MGRGTPGCGNLMNLDHLLNFWRNDPGFINNVTAWETIPATSAQLDPIPPDLHPELVKKLKILGINSLYSHQAAALRLAWEGHHIVMVTHTASGKTLGYNLPILDLLIRNPDARALYLFPTKALAQDQLNTLHQLSPLASLTDHFLSGTVQSSPIKPAIYDGDTPTKARRKIRENANLILTNPDMLHIGILPHHAGWADFFRGLSYIVIDEMHIYRGIFGSHVANVIRRLKRIARFYGSSPQFILTSATIANPLELAQGLIEADPEKEQLTLINQDGAARGEKHFIIYNPPLIDPDLGLRRSALQEGAQLAVMLLEDQIQTIVFARSRRTVEILLTYLRERAASDHPSQTIFSIDPFQTPRPQNEIRGYRSGYLPNQRREIEQGLRIGQVKAVVATNALELGIDIGALGAALLIGYPGSIAATWQQAGRAGRTDERSLSLLIATPDPLDQYLANHPEYFFGRSPEQALINPDNLLILLDHIRCAAFELPFSSTEAFGALSAGQLGEFLEYLVNEGILHRSTQSDSLSRYYWMADQYPAQKVSLRSIPGENIILQAENDLFESSPQVIGAIDRVSAYWMVHPNAIYLHEGQTYLVESLDLDHNLARLRPVNTDYYTEHRAETHVQLVQNLAQSIVKGAKRYFGEVLVTHQVIGYRQIQWQTRQQIGLGELNLPPTELQTTAFWLAISPETIDQLRQQGLWSNDPNQYGPEWPQIRNRVRARDAYRCALCGLPETDHQHHVHHKLPFRAFSSPVAANQLDNLITLCQNCHRRVELGVRIRSGLSGLGFILLNLAPLFLMCDIRDLGLYTDPQLSLAEGLPGLVVYDQVPAGIGLSQKLFSLYPDLLGRAVELAMDCPCTDGCPSCVGPGGEFGTGSKKETLALLQILTPHA